MFFYCRLCKKHIQQAICPRHQKSCAIEFEDAKEEQAVGSIYHQFRDVGFLTPYHIEYETYIPQLEEIGVLKKILKKGNQYLQRITHPFWTEMAFTEMKHNAM